MKITQVLNGSNYPASTENNPGAIFLSEEEAQEYIDYLVIDLKVGKKEEFQIKPLNSTEILKSIDTSTIISFLKEHRGKAFISWSIADIVDKASETGFEMSDTAAREIISKLNHDADCTVGISWDTISSYIDEWILKNSFDVILCNASGKQCEVKFCSLKTHENIIEYWNDDLYYFYGASKNEVQKTIGTGKTFGGATVISVT